MFSVDTSCIRMILSLVKGLLWKLTSSDVSTFLHFRFVDRMAPLKNPDVYLVSRLQLFENVTRFEVFRKLFRCSRCIIHGSAVEKDRYLKQ